MSRFPAQHYAHPFEHHLLSRCPGRTCATSLARSCTAGTLWRTGTGAWRTPTSPSTSTRACSTTPSSSPALPAPCPPAALCRQAPSCMSHPMVTVLDTLVPTLLAWVPIACHASEGPRAAVIILSLRDAHVLHGSRLNPKYKCAEMCMHDLGSTHLPPGTRDVLLRCQSRQRWRRCWST